MRPNKSTQLIILIRHAQSEGNKNKQVHQNMPDHRVPLTPEGEEQAREAGRKLKSLLRPSDKIHIWTSPYRRTRETTEGLLSTLCDEGSPFRQKSIRVLEEPRLREQDFGNFQPGADAMAKMWQERADYGHFFYRIPNGESAADAYDRISGFNDSLWRRFDEPDFADVCILVTHGLMSRVFLMKWYHWSVEYFEDLRNVNHCEFVVMKKDEKTGRYQLQNQLRTWSELKRERAARGSISQQDFTVPPRRKWGSDSPDITPRKAPHRQNTADLFEDPHKLPDAAKSIGSSPLADRRDFHNQRPPGSAGMQAPTSQPSSTPNVTSDAFSFSKVSLSGTTLARTSLLSLVGRDGGGSKSGAASLEASSDEDEVDPSTIPKATKKSRPMNGAGQVPPRSLARALNGELGGGRAMADALGDQSDAEVDELDIQMGDKQREKDELQRIEEEEKHDKSVAGSVY